MMKRFTALVSVCFAVSLSTATAGILRGGDGQKKVDEAVSVLDEFLEDGEECIPPALLREAQGIAIFPGVKKVGLGIGVRKGTGLMSARRENGSWGPPAFFTLKGASMGWQAGAQSMNIVLLLMDPTVLRNFTKRKITAGADASIAAGPKGRAADGNALADLKSDIYSYTMVNGGLFAGVAVKGSSIKYDDKTTRKYYDRKTDADELLLQQSAEVPEGARALLAKLAGYCAEEQLADSSAHPTP